jgi:hypothetical protein
VAEVHKKVFKEELERLCKIGVLKKVGGFEWAAPTFVIPKKDGTVRWVSDLRKLNKLINRKIYPLPKIADILRCRNGYTFHKARHLSVKTLKTLLALAE